MDWNFKKNNTKKFEAFSVLEAVLAILLIGVLSSIIIPYWKVLNLNKNIIETKYKANYIKSAVEGYVLRYGHIPYAADETGLSQELLLHGTVPYKTLGINKSYIVDGFGKKFTYIANYNLTQQKSKKNKSFNKGLLPITLPSTIYPAVGSSYFCTFCRNYSFDMKDVEGGTWAFEAYDYAPYIRVHAYDKINFDKNITLIKNGKPVAVKKINIQKMHLSITKYKENPDPKHKNKFNTFVEKHRMRTFEDLLCADENSENYDIIAWALISHRSNANINATNEIILNCADLVFFQSRFNLAAMIKHPCTQASLDATEVLFINQQEDRAVCA